MRNIRNDSPIHCTIDDRYKGAYTKQGVSLELCLTEVLGIVEQERSQVEDTIEDQLAARRLTLAKAYQALPAYGSSEFWSIIEEPDLHIAQPLEVLVKCSRFALTNGDHVGWRRIAEVILRRVQTSNEYWAFQVLGNVRVQPGERSMFVHDLYADLCERLIRTLMDTKRQFWEENFQHCLQFERKHVYQAFMTREGRWHNQHEADAPTRRIPRKHIASLDQPILHANGEMWGLDIEDEQAQQALLSVEQNDLALLILHLPEKLKSIIWLIFWEGRTEKDAAQVLGITDRTVRNRLREALKILRELLESEGETIYG